MLDDMPDLSAASIIRTKRDGGSNSRAEIAFMIDETLAGRLPRYQLSAWLMCVYFSGMTRSELLSLTELFVQSGRRVRFDELEATTVDKHSTGGVGDKTSLIVAPIAAAAGAVVPMISGRGLGHTGGTLDKLDSIPGYRTDLSLLEFKNVVTRDCLAISGPTSELVPADRLFYALRDVTSTIDSPPLIVASILSKKIAAGVDRLVLDVKTGIGAFMREEQEAFELAQLLVDTAQQLGMPAVALVSSMDQPLGNAIGNLLEVEEAIQTLEGEGPEDLTSLCLELAAHMLVLAGRCGDLAGARAMAERLIDSGRALGQFRRLLEAQGGDWSALQQELIFLGSLKCFEYTSPAPGFIVSARADLLGQAAARLGAGRDRAGDSVNHAVGMRLHCKLGEQVEKDEPLATLYYQEDQTLPAATALLEEAFRIDTSPGQQSELIRRVVS